MFILGLFVLAAGVVLISVASAAQKRGDFKTASLKLPGRVGLVLGVVLLFGSAIRIIGPGEVGVQDLFGRVLERELKSGVNIVNPLVNVTIFSIKTQELQETMNVPSQEGLVVDLDVSMLYRIEPTAASDILQTIGRNYQQIVIVPFFRSSARNVSVRHDARALYTEGREIITQSLFEDMQTNLADRGIIIEKVLLRSIILPPMLTTAIEEKLKADQEAQKMTFLLQKEELETQRKAVEAEGIKQANQIIAQSLTSNYIQWYRIEMLKELVNSPNNTIIIIPDDLKSVPFIMNNK